MKPISTLHARLSLLAVLWALVQSVAAQNFTMTLQPDTVTLVPGQASSFIVSMTPLNGFTNTVTLSTGTLPNGVTATFSPNPVTLPGSSLLTLNATTNATLGTFTLNISGGGGGITNTTSSSVTVNFGLLPLCFGALTGEITDAQTGLPVPGAAVTASFNFVFSDTASAQGIYNFTNLPLGLNNAPAFYNLRSTAPNYWFASTNEYAVCDATNSVNLAMVAQQFGSISGNVTIQGGGPAGGVNVQISGPNITVFAVTDTNGNYKGTNLGLNYTNAPAFYSVSTQPAGDWQATSNTTVQANSNSVVNLVLVPICHVTVKGAVFYGDTLLPTTNGSVTVFGGNGGTSTITDSSGNYTATNIALGFDNVLDYRQRPGVSSRLFHLVHQHLA